MLPMRLLLLMVLSRLLVVPLLVDYLLIRMSLIGFRTVTGAGERAQVSERGGRVNYLTWKYEIQWHYH